MNDNNLAEMRIKGIERKQRKKDFELLFYLSMQDPLSVEEAVELAVGTVRQLRSERYSAKRGSKSK